MANKLTTILDASFVGGEAYKKAQNHIKGFEGRMDSAKKSSAALETQMASLGKRVLSMGAVYAGFRIGKDIIETAAKFQKQMTDVSTLISGDATKAIDQLSEGIKKLMGEVPKSAEDLGASAYSIFSAGITDTGEALEVLKQSAILAVAGLGTTAEATDLMTSSINAFASEGLEAAKVADLIFTTVKNGKTTVSELTQGFGSVAASAAGANVKLDELLAATSALTTTGLPATAAYTQLTAAMKGLQSPTEQMSKLLKRIGFESGQTAINQLGLVGTLQELTEAADGNNQVLIEAFGRMEGFKAATALAGANSEAFTATLNDMRDGVENITQAFDKQSETFDASFQSFKNNIDIVKISIGEKLIPSLKYLLDTFNANQWAIMAVINVATKLGIAMGGSWMIGKLLLFEKTIKAAMLTTQAEMLVTGTRSAVMATTMGTSMASSSLAMTRTSVVAATLKKSIHSIPTSVKIGIGLVGVQAVITGIDFVIDKIEEMTNKKIEAAHKADIANQGNLANIREFGKESGLLTAQRIQAEEDLMKLNEESAKVFEDKNLFSGLTGVNEAKLEKIETRRKSILADIAFMESKNVKLLEQKTKAQEGFNKALDKVKNNQNIPDSFGAEGSITNDNAFKGGGGGGGDDAAKKAEKEAEEIAKTQEKIYDSLKKTQDGFSDLRLGGIDALVDLRAEHEKAMEAMTEKTDKLLDQLNELNDAYTKQVKGFDKTAAQRAVEQEKLVADLQKQIDEKNTRDGDTGELQDRLSKERAALQQFLEDNKGLEVELAEARKRAAMTDFEQFVEDMRLKREAAALDFIEKQNAIKLELDALKKQREDENIIYEAKRSAIEKINEQIKNNWSGIMENMTKRTQQFADLAKAKLDSIKKAMESIVNMTGGNVSSEDLRTAREYLPDGAAAAIASQNVNNSTVNINLNIDVGTIDSEERLDAVTAEVNAALARSVDLIDQNVSPTPSL